MRLVTDKSEVFAQLERDVLHNIVLLKHLNPYPNHTRAALLGSDDGMAALVVLDARVSDYDRKSLCEWSLRRADRKQSTYISSFGNELR